MTQIVTVRIYQSSHIKNPEKLQAIEICITKSLLPLVDQMGGARCTMAMEDTLEDSIKPSTQNPTGAEQTITEVRQRVTGQVTEITMDTHDWKLETVIVKQ